MTKYACRVLICLLVMLAPSLVYAQSSIAGVVKDTSGAVLPGVTVEASSDVLIEKVRSAVTDNNGQYRIVDLRPGTYVVTFTLPGFNTFRREGLELASEFNATVNAELRVGGLQETITVTGESPIVDVQSAKRQRTLDSELVQSLPTAKGYAALMVLIPSAVQSGGGVPNVQLSPGMVVFGGRGGRGNEGRAQVDGLNTGASLNGGGVSGYRQDVENAQEIAITTAGGLGEAEVGGPTINIVPRTGGNTFRSHFFFTGLRGAMQASNFSKELQDAGLRTPAKTNYIYDTSYSLGGPIMRDKIWFYFLGYYRGSENTIPGMFYNKNEWDPTKWGYVRDESRPALSGGRGPLQPALRLTFQLTRRDKLNLFWDEQISNNSLGAGSATNAPETGGRNHGWQRVQQVKWTATTTNKLLLEAGLGTYLSNWNTRERYAEDSPLSVEARRNLIQVNEQCAGTLQLDAFGRGGTCDQNGGIAGLNYRNQATWNADWIGAHTWNAAGTFVSGANSLKVGYQGAFHADNRTQEGGTNDLTYRFNEGIPNQLTQRLEPFKTFSRVRYNALYVQDQVTRGRLTVSGALRYDHSWSYYPEQSIGGGGVRFQPVKFTWAETKGVIGYNDITPRMGVVYDLFGTGKTALKFNAGKYLEAAVNGNGNYSQLLPSSRIQLTQNRAWTDSNGNYIPDCDLTSPLAQNLTATGGDNCGAWANPNFGKAVDANGNPIYSLGYDEKILKGWGTRPSDWQIGVTLQQEILPRVSLEVGYQRRWLQNFTVTDNLAISPADFDQFSVVAPSDPRLPGGGGYTVAGLYNIKNERFSVAPNELRTYAPDYGKISQVANGVDFQVIARMRNGIQFQAGAATGQRVTDYCEIRGLLPEQSTGFSTASEVAAYSPVNPYCHIAAGITTRLTSAGTYLVPKVDVMVSATFQSSPAEPLQANWTIPTLTVAQWLGRPLAGGAQNITVNLLAPDQMRGPRVNQLDLRVGKVLRFGQQRATVSVDMFNALNADTVLTYNQNFSPGPTGAWLVPTSVLTARTAKITVQYDF
jgi:carboxypeptidase family protein